MKEKPLVIILLGPPGAGKGSQADLLHAKFHITHISTGNILREHIKNGTPLGEKAKKYIDVGQLVPDDLIFDMLFKRIEEKDCQNGFILDGVPRTMPQVEMLDKRLGKKMHFEIVNLHLPDEMIIERLSKRVTCENCKTPYHLIFSPPKKPGICDRCGGKLIQRSDDKEEVVKNRLATYRKQTAPVIAYYEKKGLLKQVDADQSKEAVFKDILDALGR